MNHTHQIQISVRKKNGLKRDKTRRVGGVNWTATELRQLRYRLGWSRAEMARRFACDVNVVLAWEVGEQAPQGQHRGLLLEIFTTAENNSSKMQRTAIAEVIMRDRNLQQIHDTEVVESIEIEANRVGKSRV